MTEAPDAWVYGDFAPDPNSRDLVGLKARWLLECLPRIDDPRVLDYGAGEGKHLHLIRTVKPRARLVGIDIRDVHSDVDFEFHRVSSGAPLPFATASFDLVISCDVLEHVENIQRSLDEIYRVLKSGGSFIGFVPAEGGFGAHGIYRFFNPRIFRDTKDHVRAYTRRALLALFTQQFQVKALGYSYHMLGATLDATFFAAFKIPRLGKRLEEFWRGQENEFYRASRPARRRSLTGSFVRLANVAAYYESRLLKNFSPGAKGIHFHLIKP